MRLILNFALGLLMTMATLTATETADPNSPAARLLAQKRPLVIGHRGFSAAAPENTLPSFDLALTAGADLVELDYHHSSDGIPVVMHDYTLDRTTDATNKFGKTKVRLDSLRAAEVTSLDAGSWFYRRFSDAKPPLLSEALDFIQVNGMTLIERKAGDAATCIQLLREKDLINEVIVQAFDWAYLSDFHKQEPRQILGALGPPSQANGKRLSDAEKALNPKWNDEAKATGSKIVVWNRQVSPDAVADAHAKGLEVWVYTINDPKLANTLLDMGIDGIITDNPALIWRTLALRNIQGNVK